MLTMAFTVVNTIGFFIKIKVVLDRVITFTKVIIRIRIFLGFSSVIILLTKIRNALDVIKKFVEVIIALVNVIKYIYIYVTYRAKNWGRR